MGNSAAAAAAARRLSHIAQIKQVTLETIDRKREVEKLGPLINDTSGTLIENGRRHKGESRLSSSFSYRTIQNSGNQMCLK